MEDDRRGRETTKESVGGGGALEERGVESNIFLVFIKNKVPNFVWVFFCVGFLKQIINFKKIQSFNIFLQEKHNAILQNLRKVGDY